MRSRCSLCVAFLALTACGAAVVHPAEPVEDNGPETYAIALRLEEAGADDADTPRTRVTLVEIEPDGARTLEELHVEVGACWHDTNVTDVLIAARCWWGGAGARYVVVRDGDAVIARRRELDEDTGDAAWVEAGRVSLPPGADLQVLAPGRRAPLPGDPR